MSGTKVEDSSPCRNWSSASELNETQEPFLSPTDYDDEEFLRYLWREYLHPKEYEWVLIAGYIIVFVVALIGNILGESCTQQPSRGLSRTLRPRLQKLGDPSLLPPPPPHANKEVPALGVGFLFKKKKSFLILGTRTEPWNGDSFFCWFCCCFLFVWLVGLFCFLQREAGKRVSLMSTWVTSASRGAAREGYRQVYFQ